MPKLVLIDGHSLAFRAFHALPPDMSAPTGELTNATFGFMSMLLKVLQEQQPEYVVVAFDLGRPFRHDMYEEYKGHRERTPDELHTQVERIQQIVEALNIPIFMQEPWEADDILATLALQAEAQGVDSLIVTGDRDILQVVDDHITVLTSGRFFSDTIYYTPESVKAKYGLEPKQLVDYKALLGDKSDNIPGVKGIGEKGATELLQRYGTLEAIYADIDNVMPKRAQAALVARKADAELSYKLGKIVTDVPMQLDLEACRTRRYDRNRVVAIFQELAFRSLANVLPPSDGLSDAPATAAPEPVDTGEDGGQMALFEQESLPADARAGGAATLPQQPGPQPLLVVTSPALIEVAEQLASAKQFAFDTETTGTDPYASELVGLAVAWGTPLDQAAYIPIGHCDTTCLPWDTVRSALAPAFANGHDDRGLADRPGMRGLGLKDLAGRGCGRR
jgi:DNA polymerase I